VKKSADFLPELLKTKRRSLCGTPCNNIYNDNVQLKQTRLLLSTNAVAGPHRNVTAVKASHKNENRRTKKPAGRKRADTRWPRHRTE